MKLRFIIAFFLFISSKSFAGQGEFLFFQNHYDPIFDSNKGINYSAANTKCLTGLERVISPFLTNVMGYYVETSNDVNNGCLFQNVVSYDINIKTYNNTIGNFKINASLNIPLTGGSTLLNNNFWQHGDLMSHGISVLGIRNTQDYILISAADRKSVSGWMGQIFDILKNKPINRIVIPGSHDSGTYDLGDVLSPDYSLPIKLSGAQINALAKTQYYSLAEQLDRGVRYLDIRLCSDGSKLLVCHSVFARNLTIDSVFEQVRNFMNQEINKNEIVIVDIQSVQGWSTFNDSLKNKISDSLKNYLGNLVAPQDQFNATTPFGTFIQSGKRVIVLQNSPNTSLIWKRDESICNSWPNSDNPDKIWQVFQNDIDNRSSCSNNKFLQSQLVYTIQGASIDNALGNSLKDIVGPTKYNYLLKLNNDYMLSTAMRQNGNIIIEDFTSGFDLALTAKWVNWSKKFFNN